LPKQMIPITTPPQRVEMFRRMYDSVLALSTPGLEAFIESKGTMKSWIGNIVTEMDEKGGVASQAEIEQMIASYLKAVRRAAERHAEQLHAEHLAAGLPPEDLDLRVAQHIDMKIEMSDPDGAPYTLYGRMPKPQPEPGYWGLASDWLAALSHEATISTITIFRRLPINEKAQTPLAGGEIKMIADLTGPVMSLEFEKPTQASLNLPRR